MMSNTPTTPSQELLDLQESAARLGMSILPRQALSELVSHREAHLSVMRRMWEMIGGAMFDFLGNLTTGDTLTLGARHTPHAALDRLVEWMKERGFPDQLDPKVMEWSTWLKEGAPGHMTMEGFREFGGLDIWEEEFLGTVGEDHESMDILGEADSWTMNGGLAGFTFRKTPEGIEVVLRRRVMSGNP